MGELDLAQLGAAAAELIRAGADENDELTRAVSTERTAEMAYQDGLPHIPPRLTVCLIDALTGGRIVSGAPRGVREAPGSRALEDGAIGASPPNSRQPPRYSALLRQSVDAEPGLLLFTSTRSPR